MKRPEKIIAQMNQWGKQGKPFAFLIDFLGEKPRLFELHNSTEKIWWQVPGHSNHPSIENSTELGNWDITPVSFQNYMEGFRLIYQHIYNGDTYLLNFTKPTLVRTNLSPEEIFHKSYAPYKIYLKDEFVCFSPETFVKTESGKIYSFPMKGTIDANTENAKEIILNNKKEQAEHHTIVDLIRNDLSLVADNVTVEKFRYLDLIHTNQQNLYQVSSCISGNLSDNYKEKIGDILFALLPAGSVTGAPKKKTVEIIIQSEKYNRGYYTGIFGIFDGINVDSCVLIRYIEISDGQLIYKSGGGITFMSEPASEYNEMIKKVYVPVD